MKTVQNIFKSPTVKRRATLDRAGFVRFRTLLSLTLLLLALCSQKIFGQGVGISEISITPDPSSILELRSVQRGLLIPRMTTAQRLSIALPGQGLLVYDTTTKTFWVYDSGWKAIAAEALGSANQLLGMNGAGSANEYKTLYGTTNQINVLFAPGSITLSTPQDIHTGASPVFAGITLSGLTPNSGVYTNGANLLTSVPPATGILGYWQRNGSILSPSNSGDAVTTSGNIYTSGSGTITSAGLLTGSSGATVNGGQINLNNNSNFLTNINTGTSTGDVIIGGTANGVYMPKFTSAGVVHNAATGLLSTGLIVNGDITNATIDLTSKVTGVLPIVNGGTNSGTALGNNKIMVSSAGQIIEGPAGTTTTLLHGDATGLPTYSQVVNADIANGTIDLTSKVTSVLPVINGGTGYNNTYTSGQLLIGNAAGGLTRNPLTGTANQVLVSNGDGTITLATPQDIALTSSPTFAGLTLSGLTPNAGVYTDGASKLTSAPPTSGILGYWTRSGVTLTPTNSGDNVSTSGNVTTTGTGTITSAGLLTGTSGATISGGAVSINNNSNFLTGINTGSSTGNVNIGGTANSVYLPKFTTTGIVHNDATGLLSTSLISNSDITNATIDLTSKVTGVLPVINGGTGYNNTYTGGQLLIGNAAGGLTRNPLTGTANQVLVSNGDGTITLATPQDIALTSSPTFAGLTLSGLTPNAGVYTDGASKLTSAPPTSGILGYWTRSGVTLTPTNSGDNVSTSGNVTTTGTGTITSAGLLTGTSGATISGGAVSINNNSNFLTGINTGSSTGNVNIGGTANSVYLPKFTTTGIVHNDATGLLSTGLIVNSDITNATIDLTSKVTGVLPIVNGGTNSGTALGNNKIMVSSAGQIIEGPAGTTTTLLHGDATGLPTYSQVVNADIANGTIDLTSKVTSVLPVINGGTGYNNTYTSGQLLIGNAAGGLTRNPLTGTANQVLVSNGDGTITLATPQDIALTSSPVFAGLTLSGLTPNAGVYTDGASKLTSAPPTSGILGYWTRSGVTLTPTNSGDNVTTSGNVTTTGTGAVTSAGLITGTTGATISGGAVSINNNSNFLTGINTGSSTGNVNIGGTANSVYLPKFTTTGIVHNDATGLLSTSLISNSDITNATIDLTSKVTGVLPVVNGGTNSSALLINNRLMISSGGSIIESAEMTNGQVIVGKTGAAPQFVPLSGDATIDNTGVITLANTTVAPATYGDGTHVAQFTVDSKGRLIFAGNTLITGTSPVGSTLTSGNIWIGNSLDIATEQVLSGDVTMNNSGVVTVGRINGATLGSTSPTDKNILVADGAKWNSVGLTGDISIDNTGLTAIGNGKVTNNMLAGSIAAAKLIGTDIQTVGNITTGVWNAGSVTSSGAITGTSIIRTGGLATQFLKADGSVDANTYLTGNQTINFTPTAGDVTGAASGTTSLTPTLTISNKAVTLAKMDDMASGSLIYRKSAGTGTPEVQTLATLKTDLGLSGSNSGDVSLTGENYLTLSGQTINVGAVNLSGTNISGILASTSFPALTGDVTTSAGSLTTTIGNNKVTNAMLAGSIANAKLLFSSVTIGTTNISLGASSLTLAGLTSVTSGSFIGDLTGNVTGNSSTASNLSGTPLLPNGTTATTQAANDNSTKLATTAYADNISTTLGSNKVPYSGATGNVDLNGKSLINNFFADLTDNTKKASMLLTGITTGTTRTITVPDRNLTLDNVTTNTTTPLTGLLKGNGSNVSAATSGTDYAPATSGTSLLKGNGTGGFSNATASDIPNILESQVTNLTADLTNRVLTTTTVNGHALNANVTISATDITTGTLPHAQLPTLLSGDIPNNSANTTGTASNLSGTPLLPNGTTATTQAANDNSTKLATTAYADNISTTLGSNKVPYSGATGNVDLNGKSLINNFFADLTDNTKKASMLLTGITTGTTRTITVPDRNLTLDNVTTNTTTPLTGLLKGNGSNVSAATSGTDYAPATSGTSLLKGNGTGGFSNATASDIPNILESQVTNLTADLTNRVLTTTTVNGHALNANVTISATDITTGTLPHAQLPTLLSGDIPNNSANTTGTASNLSGTPLLPNGTTATTQAANDNSTKLATTAYADNISTTLGSNKVPYSGATGNVDLNGKSLINNFFADLTDNTKKASMLLTGITTGTTRTITVPDRNLTLDNVTTNTTTPLTGLLKGNGSNVSAATSGTDYAPATSGTSLLKGNGTGGFSNATASDIPNILESQVTNLTADLTNRVLTTTTVNGHALNANVTISATDITTGTLPHAQLPTLLSGDIPNNSANTTGTASNVTGTVAIGNGGTGQITASAAFNALSPITTLGDLIYGSGVNTSTRLSGNITTTPMFLKQTGTGAVSAAPIWASISKSDIGLGNVPNVDATNASNMASGVLAIAYGGTNNGTLGVTNGGLIYTDGSKLMNTGAPGSTGQILRGNSGGAPTWSSAIYPSSTSINRILYSSAANNISEITTANNGILTTSGTGVPSISNTVGAALTMPSVNLSSSSNQLVLQSSGVTGTLSWTPTGSSKTITFPDASGTVALVSGTSWNLGGNSPGVTSILGTIDNSGINIQSGTGTINLGADAFQKSINIGNSTGTTSLNMISGSGGIDLNENINQSTSLNNGTSTGAVRIASGSVGSNAISIGNNLGSTSLVERVGTGNFLLDGVGASNFTIGSSTTIGNITVGGSAQTGDISLGVSSSAQNIDIGSGTGASTISLGTGSTSSNVTVGSGGTPITSIIRASVTTSALTVNSRSTTTQTYTVTGAKVGAAVIVNPANPITTAGIFMNYSRVSAAGTVEIGWNNATPGSQALSAGQTLNITVINY